MAGVVSVSPCQGQKSCLSEAGGATAERLDRLPLPLPTGPSTKPLGTLPPKEEESCLAPAYSGVACQKASAKAG